MSYIPYTVGSNIGGIHLSPSAAKFKTVQISCYRIVLSLLLYNQIQTVHIAMSTDSTRCCFMSTDSAHCYVCLQTVHIAMSTDSTRCCFMSTNSVPVVIPDKIDKVLICLSRTKPTFFLFYRQCTLLCLQTVHIAMSTDSAHCYVYRQCTLLYVYRQFTLLCLQTVHVAIYVYRQCACGYT